MTTNDETRTPETDRQYTTDAPRDDVTVEVEIAAAVHDRISLETDAGQSVEDWIVTTIWQQLARDEEKLIASVRPEVEVEVPPEVAERARLRAEATRARGKDVDIHDILFDYVTPHTVHTLDGEPIESPDDMAGTTAGSAELAAAREAISAAVDGDADPDEEAKTALGEVAAYTADGGGVKTNEALEQLESALAADADEKIHFLKQARRLLDD